MSHSDDPFERSELELENFSGVAQYFSVLKMTKAQIALLE